MSLPTLVSENHIRCFNYYWKGVIRTGMSFNGHLYGLLDSYTIGQRARAFERGCELANHHDVVLTVAQADQPAYHLWLALTPQSESLLGSKGSSNHPCWEPTERHHPADILTEQQLSGLNPAVV